MLTQEQTAQIDKLRAKMVAGYPLFTRFLLNTPFVPDESVQTLGTDGEVIKFNPEYFFKCSVSGQAFRYLHELAHNFLGHHARYHDDWDEELQQRAMDYAANSLLVDSGLKMPSDGLYERDLKDKHFEEIYKILEKEKQAEKDQRFSKRRAKWDEQKHGKQLPSPAQTPEEKQAVAEKHQKDQAQSVQMAKMAGTMSAALQRTLEVLLQAKINWKDVLGEFLIKTCGKDDFSFTKPNRRYNDGIILPGFYSERTPALGLACDTSISVSKAQLKKQCAEIVGMMEDAEPDELHVIWCDSHICGVQVLTPDDAPELEPKGGGGTDFRPPFEYVDEEDLDIEAMIYLTDGECSRFAPEPSYPVMWIIWGGNKRFDPPYGTVTFMSK